MRLSLRITIFAAAVGLTSAGQIQTVVQPQPPLASLSADLVTLLAGGSTVSVPVIVRGARAELEAAVLRLNLPVIRRLDEFLVVLAGAEGLRRLQEEPGILSISGDLPVVVGMSVADRTMAADQTRAGSTTLTQRYAGVTGRGIGVAIVDSGIAPHPALDNKIVAAVSFVPGESGVEDGLGHGTHIAGIVAGTAGAAAQVTDLYSGGIAPGAHLVSVKVLGRNGSGRTSDVIAGLDWVAANRARYGIRVINLSLGHPVTEPSVTDPFNYMVARAVASGLVVVVSAGNRGKDADGRSRLGSITSPGNSLQALTVGAINTWGTVAPSDDTVTTYSSRGPTEYEFAVKPDVVAPGNKIVSLEAADSTLARTYPTQRVAGTKHNAYRLMSGTSMAAGMVSGAAALLLEAAPGLSPRHVKIVVQGGASTMLQEALIASGAGSVNVWASRRMASDGPSDLLPSSVIGGLPVRARGVTFADSGRMIDRMYQHAGLTLLSAADLIFVWSDPNRLPFDRLNLFGLSNVASLTPASEIIWGEISQWVARREIIWGDQIIDPSGQQIIWGDSDTSEGYQIIWGDQYRDP